MTVQLAADPSNPYDHNAVAVYIGAEHVGYIPADRTHVWHPLLAELSAAGVPAACHGSIAGGWLDAMGNPTSYGVKILAGDPPARLSASEPIITPNDRGRIDLQGEENCQDYLRGLLAGNGQGEMTARLGWDEDRIAARHGEQLLGHMTPKMSARYRPLLDYLEQAGWPATCSAKVDTGKSKLEVKLRLPTGQELDDVVRTHCL